MFQIKIHVLIFSPQTFGSRNKKQVGAYVQKGQLVIFVNNSFYRSKRSHKIRSNNRGVSYLELNEPCMVRSKLNKFKHVCGGTAAVGGGGSLCGESGGSWYWGWGGGVVGQQGRDTGQGPHVTCDWSKETL